MPENNHRLTKGTYTIYTFGCQMNVRESQTAQGILEQEGYVQALSAEQADVILFNTCCIRELAEQKAWTAIGATKKIKEKYDPENEFYCIDPLDYDSPDEYFYEISERIHWLELYLSLIHI